VPRRSPSLSPGCDPTAPLLPFWLSLHRHHQRMRVFKFTTLQSELIQKRIFCDSHNTFLRCPQWGWITSYDLIRSGFDLLSTFSVIVNLAFRFGANALARFLFLPTGCFLIIYDEVGRTKFCPHFAKDFLLVVRTPHLESALPRDLKWHCVVESTRAYRRGFDVHVHVGPKQLADGDTGNCWKEGSGGWLRGPPRCQPNDRGDAPNTPR
jgi:hypothetical protein